MTATLLLPCDRGIPNNVTARSYHHFEASPNGVVVCRYCGATPVKGWGSPVRPSTTAPSGLLPGST